MSTTAQDTTTSSDSAEDMLAVAMAKLDIAHRISVDLQNALEALTRKVEPEVAPDQEQPEPNPQESAALASLGIEAASKEKEMIRLERDVVVKHREAGELKDEDAEKLLQRLNQRYLSAGRDLWRHQMNKMRFGGPSESRLFSPFGGGPAQALMSLYRRDEFDDQNGRAPRKPRSRWDRCEGRDREWRKEALVYYNGSIRRRASRSLSWCHVLGDWWPSDYHEVAHIVPSFPEDHGFDKLLFGERTQSLQRAGNALLMASCTKMLYDSHRIVIVPVNAKETPITRWRTELISPEIWDKKIWPGIPGAHLHKKELEFRNENRPVPRFLYFRFVMALIRIKDLQRPGWEHVWAHYHERRPFPSLGNYMRNSMLRALATHFGATDMRIVESWIAHDGFDSPLQLTEDEAVEAARRVHMVVAETAERAETLRIYENSDDESETGSEECEEG